MPRCEFCNHEKSTDCSKHCENYCQKKEKEHCVNPLCKVWKSNQMTDKQIKKGR